MKKENKTSLNKFVGSKSSEAPEYEDSFYSYLHDLRSYELLTPENKATLMDDITEAILDYQRNLANFATTISELRRFYKVILSSHIRAKEYFFISSLNEVIGGDENYDDFFKSLDNRTITQFNNMKNMFNAKSPNLANEREKTVKLFSQLCMPSDVLEDFYNIICDYIMMWDDDSQSDNHSLEFRVNLRGYSDSQLDFLANKFLIPKDELTKYIKALYLARERLIKYKHIFLESHLRLVINLSQKFRNRGLPFSDVIQEGNLGLMHAIDKFDFKLGHKFSTYAVWWVKQNIVRGIAEQARTIRIPTHMLNTINQINRAEQILLQELGREPESHEIAEKLGLTVAKVNSFRKMARQAISLQSPVGNDGEKTSLSDLLEDESLVDPIDNYTKDNTYSKLYEMLNMLTEREQQIIIMRFGLFGHAVMPLSEISEKFGLTRERIRQLEIKIINKMRQPESMELLDM